MAILVTFSPNVALLTNLEVHPPLLSATSLLLLKYSYEHYLLVCVGKKMVDPHGDSFLKWANAVILVN